MRPKFELEKRSSGTQEAAAVASFVAVTAPDSISPSSYLNLLRALMKLEKKSGTRATESLRSYQQE